MKNSSLSKISFVITSLGGGGAERVLSNLANYLSVQGYEIDIIYSFIYNKEPVYKIGDKIKIHKLPVNMNFEKNNKLNTIKNTFLIIKHLRGKFKELNPDVIVSFMDKTNIYSIVAHLGLQMPLIISERTNYHFLQNKIWRGIRRVIYPYSNGMVLLSKYDYNKYDFVKNKKIIFNPLVISESINKVKKEKIILAVGRLDKNKGFDKLIQSLSMVDLKDWKVLILGEGPERSNLEALALSNNLQDKISLLGRKENIEDYYKKASIFVLSSRFEGFPNALAEAMSFGCACISFDCKTGPADIIDNGKNGILIEEGNIDLLTSRIELLINDDTLMQKYRVESIKIKDRLDIKTIAKQWEDYFEKLIVNKRGENI